MKDIKAEFVFKLKTFFKSFVPGKYKSLNELFADINITKPMYDNWTRKLSPNIPGNAAWKKICRLNPPHELKELWVRIKGYDIEEDIFMVKEKNREALPQHTALSPDKYQIFIKAIKNLEDKDVEDICYLLQRKLENHKKKNPKKGK